MQYLHMYVDTPFHYSVPSGMEYLHTYVVVYGTVKNALICLSM